MKKREVKLQHKQDNKRKKAVARRGNGDEESKNGQAEAEDSWDLD